MLTSFKLSFYKNSNELLEKIRRRPEIKFLGAFYLRWENAENFESIELKYTAGNTLLLSTFLNGKGKIKMEEQGQLTTLFINFTIPPILLIAVGFMYMMAIYASLKFGIANYGKPGFLASVIGPILFLTLFLFIGLVIQRFTLLRWLKQKIKKSLEEHD